MRNRPRLSLALCLLVVGLLDGPGAFASDLTEDTGEATSVPVVPLRDLHFNSTVILTHVDTPWHLADDALDLAIENPTGHVDLPRMRRGGVDAAFFAVWVDPQEYVGERAYQRALDLFLTIHESDWRFEALAQVDDMDELGRVIGQGHIALLAGIEGGHALGTDDPDQALRRLRQFRALGARYMGITWSRDNALGHSSTGAHPDRGLTGLGSRVVEEMERIGMVVDVSHASDATVEDILAQVSHPVMASHSGARALADHPRNLSDSMIRRIAEGQGVVCVNFYPDYLDRRYVRRRQNVAREHRSAFSHIVEEGLGYTEQGDARRDVALSFEPELDVPDLSDVADQIMHIVEVGGADTACLGTDYDGIPETPLGLEDVSRLPALTEELRRRGLPDHHLVKILGGNVIRVFRAWE